MPRTPRFNELQLRQAVAVSRSWSETLRRLGYRSGGGNPLTLKKYAAAWDISTDHFDPYAANRGPRPGATPLEALLVEHGIYKRSQLKQRLYVAGLKRPICEMCGQGEIWRGERMALILDHVNGVPDDNRLENLRIVCPNCAATLSTHCGRKNRVPPVSRNCRRCGKLFRVNRAEQRYCSPYCGRHHTNRHPGRPLPQMRKVERPPYEQLLAEIRASNYCAVGRKYGVSDTAIRKWVVWYERERAREGEESAGEKAA